MLDIYNFYFYFLLLFINYLLYYYSIHSKVNKYYYLRSTLLKLNKERIKIIYLVNPLAGLANTMRGLSSTIYLSYFCKTSVFLRGWSSILYYFNLPKEFLTVLNSSSFTKYKRFKIDIINDIKQDDKSIILTDIHGFINFLITQYHNSKDMIVLKNEYCIKSINTGILSSIVYKEIFIPSNAINEYLDDFNMKKKKKKVLGIHIRSGKFMNNFTENYFSPITNLNVLYVKSKFIIQKYNLSYIFAISDNEIMLNHVKSHFRNILLNISFKGDIIHSRFSLYNPIINNNAIRIVSEFILLSNCNVILGTKYSSFSSESCNRLLNKCFTI